MSDTVLRDAHDHRFGQEKVRPEQRRTAIVLALTAVMMVAEIAAGITFGSIALLADGLHMGSHAAALGGALLAYVLTRRYAGDRRFSFGTGKVNALAGFASAMLLAGVALLMLWECIVRWRAPVAISFDQALVVAVIGLAVNGLSAPLLGHGPRGHGHGDAAMGHGAAPVHGHSHEHAHAHDHAHGHGHEDHNLRGAYLHVLADAVTSVLAIVALIAAKYAGAVWMDPAMGVLGALIVLQWSARLARTTSRVLLDRQADAQHLEAVRAAIERTPGDRLVDLHVWCLGTGLWAAELVVHTDNPANPAPADHYRARLPAALNLVHVLIGAVRPGVARPMRPPLGYPKAGPLPLGETARSA